MLDKQDLHPIFSYTVITRVFSAADTFRERKLGGKTGKTAKVTYFSHSKVRMEAITRQTIEETAVLVGSKSVTLAGQDLRDIDDLSKINLEGANLSESRLDKVNLEGAKLKGAKFDSAHLRKTSLKEAELQETSFYRADLRDADFSDCLLQKTYLGSANLQGAILVRANLTEANLHFADLRGADLSEAIIIGINLNGARYNEKTQWPDKLVPELVGAIFERK